MSQYQSVYIPTVSNENRDNLLEISIEMLTQDSIAIANKLKNKENTVDKRFAPLRTYHLTSQAQRAREMVEALKIGLPEDLELRCAHHEGSIIGDSAELGMAITLLIMAGYSFDRKIYATGCLVKDTPKKGINIAAVQDLHKKMALMADELEKRHWQEQAVFFIPNHFKVENGLTSKGRKRYKLLPENTLTDLKARLMLCGVEVVPVSQLNDIIEKFRPPMPAIFPDKKERKMAFIFAFVFAILIVRLLTLDEKKTNATNVSESVHTESFQKQINDFFCKNSKSNNLPCSDMPSNFSIYGDVEFVKKINESKVLFDEIKIMELTRRVDAGDVKAMTLLGNMYYDGVGVSKDVSMGLELLEKAKKRGSQDARLALESIYSQTQKGWLKTMWERVF
ncbi:MAG: hypothetical protein ABL933_03335 [Methyloglobulus sp.]|nr:sel1 repeat family protein [Methyloglobulus sp.]